MLFRPSCDTYSEAISHVWYWKGNWPPDITAPWRSVAIDILSCDFRPARECTTEVRAGSELHGFWGICFCPCEHSVLGAIHRMQCRLFERSISVHRHMGPSGLERHGVVAKSVMNLSIALWTTGAVCAMGEFTSSPTGFGTQHVADTCRYLTCCL